VAGGHVSEYNLRLEWRTFINSLGQSYQSGDVEDAGGHAELHVGGSFLRELPVGRLCGLGIVSGYSLSGILKDQDDDEDENCWSMSDEGKFL
jgi:hypothetical protein